MIAIMQPYFFPYIGYLQLMAAVERFVFLDDVQHIERGWVHRNKVNLAGRAQWLTCPVEAAPRDYLINQRRYDLSGRHGREALLAKLQAAYRKAPYYTQTMALVEQVLDFADLNVARFNEHLLQILAQALQLECQFARSSEIGCVGLKGGERLLAICQQLNAAQYINPIGGQSLYQVADFSAQGVELRFLRTQVPAQNLPSGPEHLSILDGLMREGVAGLRQQLHCYELV